MNTTYRGAALLALVILILVPGAAAASGRSATALTKYYTPHALDCLNAHQRTDGGFSLNASAGDAASTNWVIMALAAAGQKPASWRTEGNDPLDFLKGKNLENAAQGTSPVNVPRYYAQAILAYSAAGRGDLIYIAGSTSINLVAKLESYADKTTGEFSPVPGSTTVGYDQVETTAWALLAMTEAGETSALPGDAARWLAAQARGNGGFAADLKLSTAPTAGATGLVVQALKAADSTDPAVTAAIANGAAFLRTLQRPDDGGFAERAGGPSNTVSTAWAVEGLRAAGTSIGSLTYDPLLYLRHRQIRSGAFRQSAGSLGNLMDTTPQALIALSGRSLPVGTGQTTGTHFDPRFAALTPQAGSVFKTRSVTVHASYYDTPRNHDTLTGTGIKPAAIRITLDGKGITKKAHIFTGSLSLALSGLANGSHKIAVTIADRAGNTTQLTRTFTVSVPVTPPASGTGTGGGTGTGTGGNTHPGGGTGTSGGHVVTPSGPTGGTTPGGTTTTPGTSASPFASISPGTALSTPPTTNGSFPPGVAPSPTATVTGSVASKGGSGGGGGGHTAAYVGGALLALVPLGFAGSWLLRRRMMDVMAGAAKGQTLPAEPSRGWQFWKQPGGTPPLDGQE